MKVFFFNIQGKYGKYGSLYLLALSNSLIHKVLTFTALITTTVDDTCKYLFSEKITLDISCESSA